MCGLTLTIRPLPASSSSSDLLDSLRSSNAARGPDCQRSHVEIIDLEDGHRIEVVLTACVLGLRGELTAQPIVGQQGVLGWNGQVFQGLDIGKEDNDTAKLFERLEGGEDPIRLLSDIEGPYAFIYLHRPTQTIHFQLDPLSRRSLLIHPVDPVSTSSADQFILSSTRSALAREQGLDMRALLGGEGGVIRLKDLVMRQEQTRTTMDLPQAIVMRANLEESQNGESSSSPWTRVAPINPNLPTYDIDTDPVEVNRFIDKLRASVRRRVENIPAPAAGDARVAVLFSGGIDCTFLAYLLHQCLPSPEPIDLINVAFAPSPIANGKGKQKATVPEDTASINGKNPARSGYAVPDRLSGLDAVQELRETCPGREWRFVEINVTYEESRLYRQGVLDLMYPSSTEMDLSLAYPLYFASRGCGSYRSSSDGSIIGYRVKAKVYLSGLGADEQLGGYSRHRHAYEAHGWEGLIEETQMDIARLPTRNLSRDDRLISSQARDARYPYLDLEFISYLSSLPIWMKCNPSLGIGNGDKRLLRLAARQCGLVRASERVKRAMQFGTRSAKVGGKGSGVKGPRAGQREVE